MEELTTLDAYLLAITHWRKALNGALRVVGIVRSFLLAFCCFLLWAWLQPEAWIQQVVVFLVSFFAFLSLSFTRGLKYPSLREWLLSLEIAHPNAPVSAFELQEKDDIDPTWEAHIKEDFAKQKKEGSHLLLSKLGSLIVPVICLVFLLEGAGHAWDRALYSIERAAMTLSYGAKLRILEGSPTEVVTPFSLGSKKLELTLLEQNLLELNVIAPPEAAPVLQLKDKEGRALQTFRLMRNAESSANESVGRFNLRFALSEDAELYLSTLSANDPAASIKIKKLPVPLVTLTSPAEKMEVWPDDRPLPLNINVDAEHPLQVVQLLIKAGEREGKELVSEVLAKDKKVLETTYNLGLENFMEQDIQEIEIIAEAVDRAVPVALIGRSKPVVIKVASAYGRYRSTLNSLRAVKQILDRSLQTQEFPDSQELAQQVQKALEQAEDSPFFDGLDRQQLRQMQQTFQSLETRPDMATAMRASDELNRFLFEHETLDDRERDRDFFIAARTLSRVLEQDKKERKIPVASVGEKMQKFLAERHDRWTKRVARLKELPAEWQNGVKDKPFERAIESIKKLDENNPPATSRALQNLSKTVEEYRKWIETLEAKEDEQRKEQEQQRQQGLANARNVLKDLQKRQGQISTKLDKAAERQAQEMEQTWGSVRMDQNSNVKGTRELEGQLRSLSPEAAERMQAAAEAMEQTVKAGNENQFVDAETGSDFAGRLLQQADNAARQAQQESQQRGRRRRVTSDQYYGNQITGGDVDLRRNYQVNRRYREDILDDVRAVKRKESSEGADSILEDYLRRVIR